MLYEWSHSLTSFFENIHIFAQIFSSETKTVIFICKLCLQTAKRVYIKTGYAYVNILFNQVYEYVIFVKEKLTDLIEQTFNREGSLYLACNDKIAFLLLNNLNDINCGHVRKCVMLYIILWTIYL